MSLKEYSLLKKITDKELKNRYNKIVPFIISKKNVYEIEKIKFENIKTHPYLYTKKLNKLGKLLINGSIRLNKRTREKDIYEKIIELPTLHTYENITMFIPSLYEIICQLPDEVFNYNKIYITTQILSDNLKYVVGDFHIGRTLVLN